MLQDVRGLRGEGVIDQLAVIDTRDDVTELHRLLGHLPPVERVGFLRWCVTQLPPGKLPPPAVMGYADLIRQSSGSDAADWRLTRTVFADLLQLVNSFHLDPAAAAVALESRVRRGRRGA